jgi:hypothetical protein
MQTGLKWKQKSSRKKKYKGRESSANGPSDHKPKRLLSNSKCNKLCIRRLIRKSAIRLLRVLVIATAISSTSAAEKDAVTESQCPTAHTSKALSILTACATPTLSLRLRSKPVCIDPSLFADVNSDDPNEALSAWHQCLTTCHPPSFNHELSNSTTPVSPLGKQRGQEQFVNALHERSSSAPPCNNLTDATGPVLYGWLPNQVHRRQAIRMITLSTAHGVFVDLPGYGFAVAPHAQRCSSKPSRSGMADRTHPAVCDASICWLWTGRLTAHH